MRQINIDENRVLEIAKQIKTCNPRYETFWEEKSTITIDDVDGELEDDGDYQDELHLKECLKKIVRKCIIDDFSILEYSVYEVHIEITLVHTKDYEDFHKYNKENQIRAIRFECEKTKNTATPISMNEDKVYENCFEALEE